MKKPLVLLMLIGSMRLYGGCGGGSSTPVMPLQIQSATLPGGTVQSTYGIGLNVSGGVAPYTWSWSAAKGSSLPPGLTLSNGNISGKPTAAGSYHVIVSVQDSQSPPAQSSAPFTIVVTALAALAITSGVPPNGTTGTIYSGSTGFSLAASGGAPPYTWSWAGAVNSSLPPGLSLPNGSISGNPTTPGTYNVVVTVTDSESPAAQNAEPYTIVIDNPPPPVISTSPAPPAGAFNIPYSAFTFGASGGLPPLIWAETGALPGGMTLGTDGKLSGTPTATGSFPITVNVQDSLSRNASPQNFAIEISARAAGFTATGSMGTSRAYHTATLLASGEVLVAGGESSDSTVSAELYDPSKKSFAPTRGSMVTPRSIHAATLLCDLATLPCNNQKVLLTGGRNLNNAVIAEAELYDPATGAFTSTGSMNYARRGHTATLLNDGRVLVTGGGVANAEFYDPKTGAFTTVTEPMDGIATLLANGEVLIAGGSGVGEVFDPVGGKLAPTANAGPEADSFTSTLLKDGRVLLAGGSLAGRPGPFCPCYNSVSGAQLFETTSVSFSATGGMSSARTFHSASLLGDGKVLLAGGASLSESFSGQVVEPLASAELFDPVSGSFALTGTMTTARRSHTATLLSDGTVLVTGGLNAQNNYLETAELYQ